MLKTLQVDIYNIEWEKPELDDCDWHCDNCNAPLDDQDGFDPYCGTWECEECGHINQINQDNIIMDLPSSIGGITFMASSNSELRDQISDYLYSTFGCNASDFDFDTDEPLEDEEVDEDFELADFCRGGDLSED